MLKQGYKAFNHLKSNSQSQFKIPKSVLVYRSKISCQGHFKHSHITRISCLLCDLIPMP